MKKDTPRKIAQNIALAIVRDENEFKKEVWNVYLLNLKDIEIDTILISTRGYGIIEGSNIVRQPKTLSIQKIPPQSYSVIEPIPFSFLNFKNEYWVTFFENGELFEKKYIFLPNSIVNDNFTNVPLIKKAGVMIK